MCVAVKIKLGEHWFVSGKTGTGKTYLVRKYLPGDFPSVAALDTKGMLQWPEAGNDVTLITRLADLGSLKTPHVIYRPRPEEMVEEVYNAFFQWCYERMNTVAWVDELMSIVTPHNIPFYLKAILTRGRERKVTAVDCTQRPKDIALVTISEATHFFVFDLNLYEDRDRLVRVTGYDQFYKQPSKQPGADKYTFWYFNSSEDRPPHLAKLVEMKG